MAGAGDGEGHGDGGASETAATHTTATTAPPASSSIASPSGRKESRVGDDYQVTIPHAPPPQRPGGDGADMVPSTREPRLVWSQRACPLSKDEVTTYLQQAQTKVGRHLTTEQILGILHWHGYDTAAASADLDAYCAHPAKQPEWTTDEQRTFVSLFNTYKKDFHKIAAQLPGKSTMNVVQYYYRWKKTGRVDSKIDRLTVPDDDEMAGLQGGRGGAEPLAVRKNRRAALSAPEGSVCLNCGRVDESEGYQLRGYEVAHLCAPCGEHWTTWGRDREARFEGEGKRRRVEVDVDNITPSDIKVALGELGGPYPLPEQVRASESRASLAALDAEYLALKKRQVEQEQELGLYQSSAGSGAAPAEPTKRVSGRGGGRANSIWSHAEVQLVYTGLRKHGKNFADIQREFFSGTEFSKTPIQIQNYFYNYKARDGLEKMLPK